VVAAEWNQRVVRRGGGSIEEGGGVGVESEGGTSGRHRVKKASGRNDVEEGGQGRWRQGGVGDCGASRRQPAVAASRRAAAVGRRPGPASSSSDRAIVTRVKATNRQLQQFTVFNTKSIKP
jgi:hypothetical protein